MKGQPVPVATEMTHVGIRRDLKGIDPVINDRVSTGRKCTYALMGSGMSGKNGLPVMTSIHLYNVYTVPCTTYGLECLRLHNHHINDLEIFQRMILRSRLGLPDRTATASLYILTGQTPMEHHLHKRALSFLHSLIKSDGPTKEIIRYQYVMKKRSSSSWIIYIKNSLLLYGLPDIHSLLRSPPPKDVWKKRINRSVTEKVVEDVKDDALSKSTLQFLNPTMTPKSGHFSITAGV